MYIDKEYFEIENIGVYFRIFQCNLFLNLISVPLKTEIQNLRI